MLPLKLFFRLLKVLLRYFFRLKQVWRQVYRRLRWVQLFSEEVPFLVLWLLLGQGLKQLEEIGLLTSQCFPFLKRGDSVKLQDRVIEQLKKVSKMAQLFLVKLSQTLNCLNYFMTRLAVNFILELIVFRVILAVPKSYFQFRQAERHQLHRLYLTL